MELRTHTHVRTPAQPNKLVLFQREMVTRTRVSIQAYMYCEAALADLRLARVLGDDAPRIKRFAEHVCAHPHFKNVSYIKNYLYQSDREQHPVRYHDSHPAVIAPRGLRL